MRDAKNNLSKLVKRAPAGEDIVIPNHGKPPAMLTRLPPKHRKNLRTICECKSATSLPPHLL